eukprot:SAG31_NODE_5310_length_2617_cov_3.641384_4_plen_58_part_01
MTAVFENAREYWAEGTQPYQDAERMQDCFQATISGTWDPITPYVENEFPDAPAYSDKY